MSEIDVSKCEFYCEKYDGCYCFNSSEAVYAINPNEHNDCECNESCYYKQLQQLKQQLQLEKDNVAELNELLISYKEENEELKTNLEKARVMNPYINCKNCKKEQKLKKVEDRIQDIKFDDEHNIEIMNDILQIITGKENEEVSN